MSTMFHIQARVSAVIDADEARAALLRTGRRPAAMDARLARSARWARVELGLSASHPDARCSTAPLLYIRALSDVWDHQHGATGDATKQAKNPIRKAYGGQLDQPTLRVVEWRHKKMGEDHPSLLLFERLDVDPDLASTTVFVPDTWVKGISEAACDASPYGDVDDDAGRAASYKIALEAAPLATTLRIVQPDAPRLRFTSMASHAGRCYVFDDAAQRVLELREDDTLAPVAWFNRDAAVDQLWEEAGALYVAKRKGGVELRGDAATPLKATPSPTHSDMRWLGEARGLLQPSDLEGSFGRIASAGRLDQTEWLVTRGGLVGIAREGVWRWWTLDTRCERLGPLVTGATMTPTHLLCCGAAGILSAPLG